MQKYGAEITPIDSQSLAEVYSYNDKENKYGFMIDHGLHSDENDRVIAKFVLMSLGQPPYHLTPAL